MISWTLVFVSSSEVAFKQASLGLFVSLYASSSSNAVPSLFFPEFEDLGLVGWFGGKGPALGRPCVVPVGVLDYVALSVFLLPPWSLAPSVLGPRGILGDLGMWLGSWVPKGISSPAG